MSPETLKEMVVQAIIESWAKILGLIPNILAMVVLILVGYLASKGLQKIGTMLLQRLGFDRLSSRVGLQKVMAQVGIRTATSEILGKLVFWLFMLTFLVSAAEILGLRAVSQTLDAFVRYVPNVIAAVVIFIVGMALAHFLREGVQRGAEGMGVDYAKSIGDLVYVVFIVVVGSLAVGQLKIETALFNRVVEIILLATGAALALGLGLGTRDVARHIVAGVYIRDLYRPGSRLSVGGESGALQDVGTLVSRLRTPEGHIIYIPNGRFAEVMVREEAT